MSVTNGQTANQTTFNDAFVSKTQDSTTVGKIVVNKPADGASVDVQVDVNDLKSRVTTLEGVDYGTQAELDAHINDAAGAHASSAISYDNAVSGLAATDVKAALDEVVADIAAVGGGPVAPRSVTTTDTATNADVTLLLSDASFVQTLYAADGNDGRRITLIHRGTSLSQKYTINTTGGDVIKTPQGSIASGAYKLCTFGESLTLESDGADWIQVDHVTDTGWINLGEYIKKHTFTITSGNATLGAVYTNNGGTFVVAKTVAAGTTLICRNTSGTPAASGTLTKSSGTGDATLTFSAVTTTGIGNIGATTTPPTLHGDAITSVEYMRKANIIRLRKKIHNATAGVGGSGDYIWPMIENVLIDTNICATETGGSAQSGSQVYTSNVRFIEKMIPCLGGWIYTAGNYAYPNANQILPYSSSSFRFYIGYYPGLGPYAPQGSTYATLGNAGNTIVIEAELPVSDWQP